MSEIAELKTEIEKIKQRNKSVEANKAWERSGSRTITICAITYITASVALYLIGVQNYFLNALIPTAGFFLSTLSLPPIKKWWIKKYLER